MKNMKDVKVLFIETRKKFSKKLFENIEDAEKTLKILPQKFLIAYSIQYKELAHKMEEFFEKKGRKISGNLQILGCSMLETKEKNVLLISSGRFHAVQLCLQGKNVYIYENENIFKLAEEEIKNIFVERKVALSKFYSADTVGILVSYKPGQENLKLALNLKEKICKMDKKIFIFISDNINLIELNNFHIESWVNTACPGLALSSKNIVNYANI